MASQKDWIKKPAQQFSRVVSDIFSMSLEQRRVPKWKESIIVPMAKCGSKTVALTPLLMESFEKLMF